MASRGGSDGWRDRGGKKGGKRGTRKPKNQNTHDPGMNPKPKVEPTPEQSVSTYFFSRWKQQIRQPPRPADTRAMQNIWDQAYKIQAEGDRDQQQQLAQDLADGTQLQSYRHIQEVLSLQAGSVDNTTFLQVTKSFLSVITHSALLNCFSVDMYVGDIYNVISGSNGTRAIPFFVAVNDALARHLASGRDPDPFRDTLVSLVTGLREVLRRTPKSLLHEDLPILVKSINETLRAVRRDKELTSENRETQVFDEIQRLLARAQIVYQRQSIENVLRDRLQEAIQSTYPRGVEFPANKHDNDKLDFTEIKIFPTEEEIRSGHEFLPSPHPDHPHFLEGVERLLDTQFRLLRHVTFNGLKSAINGLLQAHEKSKGQLQSPEAFLADVIAHVYRNARVKYVSYDKYEGFEVQIGFEQPHQARKKESTQRKKWWNKTKRLEEGSTLCLLVFHDHTSSILFFTVSQKITKRRQFQRLANEDRFAVIPAKFVSEPNHAQMELLVKTSIRNQPGHLLIEFPGLFLDTIAPILQNLQRMQHCGRLPFGDLILLKREFDAAGKLLRPEILPPLYARKTGFKFDLNPILKDASTSLTLAPGSLDPDMARKLEFSTPLDKGQCEALVAALTHEFVLIKGPPGTGKSYLGTQIMRILVANKKAANLGPIIVVCCTNHALDQFLEHLVGTGIDNVIRIGGQSFSTRSKVKNLRLRDESGRTGFEKSTVASAYGQIEQNVKSVSSQLDILKRSLKARFAFLDRYLQAIYPDIYHQFVITDNDGLTQVGVQEPFELWSAGRGGNLRNYARPAGNVEGILRIASIDVYRLPLSDRRILREHWFTELKGSMIHDVLEAVGTESNLRGQITGVYDEVDRRMLGAADVIGVTTTGLAKRITVLQRINARVVICEEAGEILEAHMLSALVPSVEHLIQIGDHQQLRPQINNFDLSFESATGKIYQLARSQFERLVVSEPSNISISQLDMQRRMRPQISTLIRNTLYPGLIDHVSVQRLPNVAGMRKNVFWYHHSKPEDSTFQGYRSKSNAWEVGITRSLVRHIIRQDTYNSKDIAVLTPYTSQLHQLRAALQQEFEIIPNERDEEELAKEGFMDEESVSGVEPDSDHRPALEKERIANLRVATVDNFQGEEAKVVVISLVRSNHEKTVGFLGTTNRISVLLSRAQHGMYLIGNSETYSSIPRWSQVLDMLRAKNCVGEAFSLRCSRHPETEILMSNPTDFCSKACERFHKPCGHLCRKLCGEPCGPCSTEIPNVTLPCGHIQGALSCYQARDVDKVHCTASKFAKGARCTHSVEVPCHQDVSPGKFICPKACTVDLECGHVCPGSCGACLVLDGITQSWKLQHQKCAKVCGRRFTSCNHTCPKACHTGKDCGVCLKKCEVRCVHSWCDKQCHEPCAPCIETCQWACEHQGKCLMPCAAPCSRLPCSRRCLKTIPACSHQCPGLCGEICPQDYCQLCSTKQDQRVDLFELKTYGEIDLDATPIIVLSCGHFFTAETLDPHVGMNEVYEKHASQSEFIGLREIPAHLAQHVPRCPNCQEPIKQHASQRYNRVINPAVIDEMTKRFLVDGRVRLQGLEDDVHSLESYIERTKRAIKEALVQMETGIRLNSPSLEAARLEVLTRVDKSTKLVQRLIQFLSTVTDMDQPVRKLYDATQRAIRSTTSTDEQMKQLSLGCIMSISPDRRLLLGGCVLALKLGSIIIADEMGYRSSSGKLGLIETGYSIRALLDMRDLFFKVCMRVIADCPEEKLPRFDIEARLYYAKIAYLNRTLFNNAEIKGNGNPGEHVQTARELLQGAEEICTLGFANADGLRTAVEQTQRQLGKPWYEPVSAEEVASIKAAMISGSTGLPTHSGRWYYCQNGHTFAIGECGMPTELARCLECGAPVGGQDHQNVMGTMRAREMED